MSYQEIQGFTRDPATGALVVTGIGGGGGGAETDPIAVPALNTHKAATTSVHGIADTSKLQILAHSLVLPLISTIPSAISAVAAINRMTLLRCVIPKTGFLRDITVYVGASSGNYIGAVYDVGEASGTNSITELWDSGSVVVGAANGWRVIGDPNLAVTAGQNVYLGMIVDNITATFGRISGGNSPNGWGAPLPASFLPTPGGQPAKLAASFTAGSFAAPTPIADATLANPGTTVMPILIARVS